MPHLHSRVIALVAPLAFLLLAPAGLAQSTTGERQTYAIELRQGVNLVSLPVVPDVTEMSAVVADILPDVSLVQDDRGKHAIPSLEIDEIGTWRWSEAYKIHTEAPATLVVQGGALIPELSPLVLEGGAHWIPYINDAPLPVEEALASILPSLSRVEDEDGRLYEPGNQNATLDSMRVGRGYRVWLTARDTLRYPFNQNAGGGNQQQVGTLAQALALRGLESGDEVNILGYYAPNDGGGGAFRVENSGVPTDGGLVHVLNEHVSAPVTEVIANDNDRVKPLALPPGARLVYGSVTVEILRPNGNVLASIDGRYLHGHEWVSAFTATPLIDYESGEINDRRKRLAQWCQDEVGNMWACDLRVTYRHTTSNLRLRRLNLASTLNVDWFGARTTSQDPSFDNQPVFAHVINVANELNRWASGTVTTILVPKTEVYEYYGSLQLGKDLTLKGGGGTRLITVTNDLGHVYQPVRIKQEATILRVKSGQALKYIRMEKDSGDPNYLPPDVKHRLHGRRVAISIAPYAESAGLEDIVLDGNWQENRQAWEDGWATYEEKESAMRNTPGWSGFISNSHNGVPIPIGQQITLRNVAVTGYGAAGLLGDANNVWDAQNVLLGNSLWNHTLYRANGTWTNLTFTGFSWGHAAWHVGRINNLVFENGAPGPYRPDAHVMGIRGADAYSEADIVNDPDNSEYVDHIRSDGTPVTLGTVIDGFYVDLRGSELVGPWGGIGPRLEIRNGVVIMDAVWSNSLFRERSNGYQKALYPDYAFENIVIYDNGLQENGERREGIFGSLNVTNTTFRNITTNSALLGATGIGGPAFTLRANWRNHHAWSEPQVLTFEGIYSDSPHQFIGLASTHQDAVGATYYIKDSRFNNTTNTFYANDEGTGELSQFNGDPSKLEVYMDGVAFRLHGGQFENLELFFALTWLRDCTDSESGRTSEDGGRFTFAASGGETEIDIPTNLFWEPLDPSFTTVTEGEGASGLFESFEYRAPDGSPLEDDRRGPSLRLNLTRALNPGEEVTFSWDAAIRPWSEGPEGRAAMQP